MASCIEIDSIELTFDQRPVLHDVFLTFKKGEITALAGRNGSGKSSLMKILFGSIRATHQNIRVDGRYMRNLRSTPFLANYMPQFNHIPGYLTIRETFDLYRVQAAAITYLDDLSLDPSEQLDEISGGQRRLVELLACLYAPTEFTMLDEPFTHIAPVHNELICNIIRQKSADKGILISDHQYRTVLQISDKIFLCHQGTVRQIAQPEDLQNSGYIPNM